MIALSLLSIAQGFAQSNYVYGPLTNAELRNTAVPVTITGATAFYPAIQPVSGTVSLSGGITITSGVVSVSNFPASFAVTGPLTNAELRAVAVPVSGAFWQATQPVSGTFFQATQPVSIASMPSTPVTGTFWQATQPVSGTFWQATQPVSGTVTANAGTGVFDITPAAPSAADYLPVRLTDGAAFYVAGAGGAGGTQYAEDTATTAADLLNMAGVVRKDTAATLVDTDGDRTQLQVDATGRLHVNGSGVTQPVSGTFWQATQPVSGTFWQATQPVSGTFFQATQPVSLAGTQSVNAAQLAGTTTDTNSGVKSAGTLRVVLATDQPALTNKLLVTPDSVALPANQSVNVSQINGVTALMGNGGTGTGSQRVTIAFDNTAFTVNAAQSGTWNIGTITTLPALVAGTANIGDVDVLTLPALTAGTNRIGSVRPVDSADADLTSTKGTQTARAIGVHQLKDAGRNQTNFFMAAGVAAPLAEALQSVTGYKSGAAVGATTTPAVVTTGKTYRIESITISYQSLATAGGARVNIRANTGGAVVIGSPLVITYHIGSQVAVAGVTSTEAITFADGLEFAAGTGIGVAVIGTNTVGAAAAAGFVVVSINGYEY